MKNKKGEMIIVQTFIDGCWKEIQREERRGEEREFKRTAAYNIQKFELILLISFCGRNQQHSVLHNFLVYIN